MYLLAFETTGPVGSVSLLDLESKEIITKKTDEPMSHLKYCMTMAQELMQEKGATTKEISAVAASIGPGSFTGIRIGVSAARAVAQALAVPAIAVPTLDQFRRCAKEGEPVCIIENARRGQVYGAVFDEQGRDVLKPGPYMLTDVLEAIQDAGLAPVFYGDGVEAYDAQLQDRLRAPESTRYQSAERIAYLGAEMLDAGKTVSWENLLPDYMRKTEAEQKLEDGTLAKYRAAKMAKFRGK